MKIVLTHDGKYLPDIDILVRVYESQVNCDEKEQCCGEILFKPYLNRQHIRFTSWLPRGLVEAINLYFKDISGDYFVQISNELPDNIGVLTSCSENFDIRLKNENNFGESIIIK